MTSDLNWERYRTFLAVLTEGSLSAAARALGITQPTAGRHVAALEAAFGQTLFTRSPSGLLPTDAALALRGHAEALRSAAAAFERAAASHGAGVRGTVRISASDVIAVEVLPPLLAQLRREHPGLVIELVPTDRIQDVLNREADIAVRMASPSQDALVARRIGELEVALYARDDYLTRYGAPSTLDALAHHALIGFDTVTPFVRSAGRGLPSWTREAFALRTDSNLAQLAMIRAGYGIGFCQSRLAQRDSRLVRVLPNGPAVKLETWVVMHEDLRASPRCRAVFDALANGLRGYAEGTGE
ncbi:LysR family transcriptional regulator [Burkholderia multivorans]|uniref:LysR family transcriptional regulator n=1 Tax=Burkholderia multivorans TaxID=87883 RepID=UPI000D00C173|nr:LysR family transcriptional regulator [Burkholderia multivorans]MBR8242677.1 LysR family transcriptional regulator [Burkholderia multivorans]MDR9175621.1 HTH-type transcriptional regulator CysL [Burkholderia multivorans]MDR9190327.1 HTH-type transcriptional regulator CysL [Burkholderia multivorans]MDR9195551.1 HTH-type transcriptional regulator CysL [Burkholderia multivorans]MDR9203886.1 HTH-type transcriptional regulator CysL [Burkholderia multivorans]